MGEQYAMPESRIAKHVIWHPIANLIKVKTGSKLWKSGPVLWPGLYFSSFTKMSIGLKEIKSLKSIVCPRYNIFDVLRFKL